MITDCAGIAGIEDIYIPMYVPSFLSTILKICFGLINIIMQLVFTQYHWIHVASTIVALLYQFITEAIDTITKWLHILINFLLAFLTNLFVQP